MRRGKNCARTFHGTSAPSCASVSMQKVLSERCARLSGCRTEAAATTFAQCRHTCAVPVALPGDDFGPDDYSPSCSRAASMEDVSDTESVDAIETIDRTAKAAAPLAQMPGAATSTELNSSEKAIVASRKNTSRKNNNHKNMKFPAHRQRMMVRLRTLPRQSFTKKHASDTAAGTSSLFLSVPIFCQTHLWFLFHCFILRLLMYLMCRGEQELQHTAHCIRAEVPLHC